ncbi:MAG: helix-turn-helix domain-containing protein [Acidimicrobiia bacterium]|nr:helix-turn-helix domain-containing protein [Acidimicrobiia bacterium]NNC75597.1 helix-turn-helix domain-containing protein [Acidimicrobiia bacterium]
MTEEFLTTRQVLDLIKVDKSTVYRMAEGGRIPAVKVGRQWRFPADQIQVWLDGNQSNQVPEQPVAKLVEDIPLGALHSLLQVFAELLGVMMVLTDMEGRPITPVANPCGLMTATGDDPEVLERCVQTWTADEGNDLSTHYVPTALGFECIHGYLRSGDRLLGMVLAGGVAAEPWPPPVADVVAGARLVGLDPTIVTSHIEEVYYLDRLGKQELKSALPRIANALSRVISDHTQSTDRLRAIASLAGVQ